MTQSLPFVHTARRYYRLGVPVRALDWRPLPSGKRIRRKEVRTGALRGSKSRNKVSVGEPAEGSLLDIKHNATQGHNTTHTLCVCVASHWFLDYLSLSLALDIVAARAHACADDVK